MTPESEGIPLDVGCLEWVRMAPGTLSRLPGFPSGGRKWAWAECGLTVHLTCIGCLPPSQLFLPASTTPPRNHWLLGASQGWRWQILTPVAVCDVSPHLDRRTPLWSPRPCFAPVWPGLSCHGRTVSCGSLPGCGGAFIPQVAQGDWCTGAAQPPWPGPDCKPFAR